MRGAWPAARRGLTGQAQLVEGAGGRHLGEEAGPALAEGDVVAALGEGGHGEAEVHDVVAGHDDVGQRGSVASRPRVGPLAGEDDGARRGVGEQRRVPLELQ
jgi:ABC-type taurine transport system ATPase subunit